MQIFQQNYAKSIKDGNLFIKIEHHEICSLQKKWGISFLSRVTMVSLSHRVPRAASFAPSISRLISDLNNSFLAIFG